MRSMVAILTGVGMLIALYLFLSNGDKTVKIINALGGWSTSSIKSLQGR